MSNGALVLISLILMIPGIAGVFIPFVPGIQYMFLIAFLYGIADGFVTLTGGNIAALLIILVLSLSVDFLSGLLGAHIGGASRRSILFGLAGAVIGLIIAPPFGGIIGIIVGIAAGELIHKKRRKNIAKAVLGGIFGVLTGMFINFFLAILFYILFIMFAV